MEDQEYNPILAKHYGQASRRDGLDMDWQLIHFMGGPTAAELDAMTEDEYAPIRDAMNEMLNDRPHVTIEDNGEISMAVPGTDIPINLRPRIMKDVKEAGRSGRGDNYRMSRSLISRLSGYSPAQIDELPVGHYLAIVEAIGATFR